MSWSLQNWGALSRRKDTALKARVSAAVARSHFQAGKKEAEAVSFKEQKVSQGEIIYTRPELRKTNFPVLISILVTHKSHKWSLCVQKTSRWKKDALHVKLILRLTAPRSQVASHFDRVTRQ